MTWVLFLCAALALGGSLSYMNNDKKSVSPLHYVYLEPRVKSKGPAPVLVMLHGVGSNEEGLIK